jgi:hypothetical protein
MNKHKLNSYISKMIKKLNKDMKREKARCARTYPDWRDDEFNMLDNLFIWGYNTNPNVTPSFCSWNDAYVYYNRATKTYYMIIDIEGVSEEQGYSPKAARVEMGRLLKIKDAFGDFCYENGYQEVLPIFPFPQSIALEGASLEELHSKLILMLAAYRAYSDCVPAK